MINLSDGHGSDERIGNMFVTHPSVRIRGTENNYNPAQCLERNCPNKAPHLHCPFCQKHESFYDPVILKAHYRVKHVDKGIDFAGLKILRCCDHCDIVGAIKGEKKFKGAHWHCYKCKNGFNRRDEAIKHYRTHFRNPQTTFQIQVTQEVNNPIQYYETQDDTVALAQEGINTTIHPILTEAIISTVKNNTARSLNNENDSSLANGHTTDGEHIHVSVAANETVGPPDGQGAIMIIHEEHIENGTTCQAILNSSPNNHQTSEKLELDQKVIELQQELKRKELLAVQKEEQLLAEITQLKMQIQLQSEEITNLRKREEELLQQIRVPLDSKLQELMTALQVQHFELLQQQLVQIRRAAFAATDVEQDTQVETFQTDQNERIAKPSMEVLSAAPDHTVVTLVVDRNTGNLVPFSQSMLSSTSLGLTSPCSVELSPNQETLGDDAKPFEPVSCKSPTDSLVIVDLTTEEMKKREADDSGSLVNDVKRKK